MNLSAAIANARSALQDGDSRLAIQIYKNLLKERPEDIRLQERFADLLREDAQLAAAAWTYRAVANYWEEEGFFLRALSVYKKLLRCEREDQEARLRLANLYTRLHLIEEAREEYLRLAELFTALGKLGRKVDMLRRALELESGDVDVRMQLYRVLRQQERDEEVLEILASGLERARTDTDADAYLRIAPRYLEVKPDDKAVAKRMKLLLKAERRKPTGDHEAMLGDEDIVSDEPTSPRASLASRPFQPSSEVLLEAPEHAVAAGIRTRRHGDFLEALRILDCQEAEEYSAAAGFERAVAFVEVGKCEEAMSELEHLLTLPTLSMHDQELVWFYLGLAHEGLRDYEQAQRWFERIEATSPGQSEEVAVRLTRYQNFDEDTP